MLYFCCALDFIWWHYCYGMATWLHFQTVMGPPRLPTASHQPLTRVRSPAQTRVRVVGSTTRSLCGITTEGTLVTSGQCILTTRDSLTISAPISNISSSDLTLATKGRGIVAEAAIVVNWAVVWSRLFLFDEVKWPCLFLQTCWPVCFGRSNHTFRSLNALWSAHVKKKLHFTISKMTLILLL